MVVTVGLTFSGLLVSGKIILKDCLNSDSLYLTAVYKDVFQEGGNLTSWILSPAPCFFPDMFLYYSLLTAAGDLALGIVLYGTVYLLTCTLLLLLISRFLSVKLTDALTALSFAMLLFVALLCDDKQFILAQFLFVAGRHGGTLISGLSIVALALWILRDGFSFGKAFLLFGLAWVALLSDILIVPQFLVPLIGVTILFHIAGIVRLRFSIYFTGLFVSAFICARWTISLLNDRVPRFVPELIVRPNISSLINGASSFVGAIYKYGIHDTPLFSTILIVWFVVSIWIVYSFLRKRIAGKWEMPFSHPNTILCFLILFFLISISATVVAPLVKGVFMSIAEIRYLLPVYTLPLFVLSLIAMNSWRVVSPWMKYPVLAFIVGYSLFRIAPGVLSLKKEDFKLPYPDIVRFVDEVAKSEGLEYGYCDYWNSNYLFVLSRANVRTVPIHPVLWPYFWIANYDWFWKPTAKNAWQYPERTFIITDRLSNERMEELFGPPASVRKFVSPNIRPGFGANRAETEIYIYNRKEDIVFRNFIRSFFLKDEYDCASFQPASSYSLKIRKHNHSPSDNDLNVTLQEGVEYPITFSPRTSGDTIEISVDSGDEYRLTFFEWTPTNPNGVQLSETLLVSPHSREGMWTYFLPLPEGVRNKKIIKVNVTPLSGDGLYRLGHLFIYRDSYRP